MYYQKRSKFSSDASPPGHYQHGLVVTQPSSAALSRLAGENGIRRETTWLLIPRRGFRKAYQEEIKASRKVGKGGGG